MENIKYKYTATISQPQMVGVIKLDPSGGVLSEKEIKALKKDAYGASLFENKMLVLEEVTAESKPKNTEVEREEIPDFDNNREAE